jgi:L-cystine transport system ATP-binding protein
MAERDLKVKIRGIRKSFGKNAVLQGIDLSVYEGEVVVLLGPSGSGKSTLLRCINFLEHADAGTLDIGGLHINFGNVTKKHILEVRRRTAFVFQNFNLFRHRTALENVMEGLIIARKIPAAEARERAIAALNKVGLPEKRDAYPHQLSGGQQQRVAIARAIALDADIILFDEPTSALDPELIEETLQIIKNIAKDGITMIVVTHEVSFAFDVAQHVIFMENGSIVEEGSPSEVLITPREDRTKQFFKRTQSSFIYNI